MLALKDMLPLLFAWNRRWGAPYGHESWWRRGLQRISPERLRPHLVGPFGFQADNSSTRRFEYAWAYQATPLIPAMHAVDVGGSLAGFQFVLAREGLNVVNVDPGESVPGGWPLDTALLARLNRAFKTSVELKNCPLEEADIPTASIDRVFSISTREHMPEDSIASALNEARRILRPGGLMVLTVDLFFDLVPFTERETNPSGHNVDVAELVERSGLDLIQGNPSELYGFPRFIPDMIQARLSEYLYGSETPALVQALVLGKP
jgi:SAM-dependent methyltransferase